MGNKETRVYNRIVGRK